MKEAKYKTQLSAWHRSIALFVAISFLACDTLTYAQSVHSPQSTNHSEASLQNRGPWTVDRGQIIPSQLGTVEEEFIASRSTNDERRHTIFFIQDAHDSLEAQENIAKIIYHLVDHQGVKTVFEEGHEGPVPTDEYFGFIRDPKIKEKVSYFLMDKLRLGGAEYAHINRKRQEGRSKKEEGRKFKNLPSSIFSLPSDFRLIGVDSQKLHKQNIRSYRRASRHQKEIGEDLDALRQELGKLAQQHFSREFKDWLKLREKYQDGKIQLMDYVRRAAKMRPQSTVPRRQIPPPKNHGPWTVDRGGNYPILQLLISDRSEALAVLGQIKPEKIFEEIKQLEQITVESFLTSERDREIYQDLELLRLLEKLNQLELSAKEYDFVKLSLQDFKTENLARFLVLETGKSMIFSRRWEGKLKKAAKFYETARAREDAVAVHLKNLLASNPVNRLTGVLDDRYAGSPEKKFILVFGGFHKERIKQILTALGVSYVIITPKISAPSPRHQQYYKTLMTIGQHPFELSLNLRTAAKPVDVMSLRHGRGEVWFIEKVIKRNLFLSPMILNQKIDLEAGKKILAPPLLTTRAEVRKRVAPTLQGGIALGQAILFTPRSELRQTREAWKLWTNDLRTKLEELQGKFKDNRHLFKSDFSETQNLFDAWLAEIPKLVSITNALNEKSVGALDQSARQVLEARLDQEKLDSAGRDSSSIRPNQAREGTYHGLIQVFNGLRRIKKEMIQIIASLKPEPPQTTWDDSEALRLVMHGWKITQQIEELTDKIAKSIPRDLTSPFPLQFFLAPAHSESTPSAHSRFMRRRSEMRVKNKFLLQQIENGIQLEVLQHAPAAAMPNDERVALRADLATQIRKKLADWAKDHETGDLVTILEGDPEVWPDADLLDEILWNAIEFAGLTRAKKGLVRVRLFRKADKVILQVLDQGTGINPFSWKKLGLDRVAHRRTNHAGTGTGIFRNLKDMMRYVPGFRMRVWTRDRGQVKGCLFSRKSMDGRIQRKKWKRVDGAETREQNFKTGFSLIFPCPVSLSREEIEKDNAAAQEEILHESRHWHEIPGTLSQKRSELRIGDPEKIYALHESIYVRDQVKVLKRVTALSEVAQSFWAQIAKDKGAGRNAQESFQKMHDNEALIARGKSPGSRYGSFKDWNERLDATSYLYTGEALLEATILQRIDSGQISSDFLSLSVKAATILHEFFIEKSKGSEGHLEFTFKEYLDFCAKEMLGSSYDHEDLGEEAVLSVPGTLFFNRLLNLALNQFNRMATRNPSDLRSELRALQDKRSLAAKALEQAVSPAETKNPVAKENRSLRAEVRTNFSGPRNLKTGSVGDGSDFGENEPVYQEAKKRYEQWRTEGFRDRKVAALIGLAGDFEKTIENLRRVRFENKAQAPAIFQLKMQLRFATGAVWLVLAEQAQKAENIQEFEKNLSQAWGYLGTVKLALKETGHEDDTEQLLGIHQAEFLPVYARARCRWLQYYWVVYTTLNGKEDPTHRAYAQSFLGAAHFQLEKAKHAVVRAEKWIQAGRGNGTILTSLKDNLQFFEEKFHGVQRQQRYLSHTYLRGVYDLWEGRISREHPYAREILARNWDIPGIAISAYHLGKHPSKSKALVAELFMLDRLGELTKHDTMKVLGFGLHPNSVRGQPRLNIEVDLVAEFYDGNPFGLRGIYLIDFIWKGADQNMVPVNELTDKYQLAAQYMSAQGFPIAGALRIFSGLHIKDVLSPKDLEGRTKTISLATNLSRTGNGNNKLPEVEKVLLWGQSVPNIAQVLHKHVSGRSEVRSTSNRKKPGFSWPQHNDDIVIESPFGKISWKELGWEVLPKAREYIEGVAPASEYEASRPSRLDRLKWRLSTLKKAMKGELSLYKDGSGFKHFVRKNYMWLVQSFGRTDWALSPEDWEIIGDHLMLDLPAVGDDELLASQMPGPTRGIRSEVRNALMRYLLSLGGEETQAQRVIHEVFRGKKYEFPPQAKEAAAWVSAWEKEADAASTLMDTVRDLYFAKTFLTLDSLEYKGIQKRMGEIYIQARQQAYTKIGRAPPSIAKVGIPFEADRPKIPAYLILPATLSPKKRLPVVVLFHGLSGSKEFPQFDSLEEQFIAANIGVLRVDLFGHGENQDRVRTPADFARYADAIATFFKEDSRLDSDRLGAVGFSLGGWVTLQAAIRSPIFQKNLRAAAVINAPVRPFYLDEKQFLKMREHLQAIFQDKNIKHLSSQMNAMALSEDEVRVLLGLPIPLQIFSGEKDLIISADTKFLKKVLGESGVQTVKKQMHYLLPEARDKMFGEITRQTSQAFLDYHRSEARSAKSAGAADAQEGIENGVTAIKKARKQDDLVRFFKLNLSAPLIVYGVLGVTLSAAAVSLGLTLAIAVLFKFFWSPGARFNLPDYWLRRFDLSPNTISFSNSNSSARSELRSKGRRKTQLPAWHSYPSQSVAVLKKELKRARWKKIRAVLKKTNGDWEEAGVRLKIEKRNGYSRSNILAQEVTDLGYWTNAQKYIRRKEKSSARSEMRTKHFSKRVLLLEELSREDRLENIQTAFAPGGLRREKGVTPESIQRAVSLLRKYGITSSQQPWFLESTALNDEISHKLGRDAKHGMRILFLDATQGPTGSFKDFSPIPLYDAADQGTAPKEAWVASTGNQAAAWYEAVRRVNEKKKQTSLIIVMGMDAQAHKKETLVKKGATILDLDPETGRPLKDYEEALELARKKVAENPNEKLLASHADSQVVSGYASIIEAGMDELLRKKKLSAGGKGEGIVLLAPVGSGGFYAGLMEILAKFPKARTFGVSAAPADAMFESIYGGRIIHRSGSSQIVDGTAATPEPFAYDLIRATSDGLLRVSESQALHNTALIQSYFPSKPLEATAGLSLAALFRHKDLFAQANTVIIPLTSKNQSLEIQQKIAKLLQRSEMRKRKDLYPLANERLPRLKQGGARAQVYPQLIHKFQKQNMTHFPEGFIVAKKRPQQVGPRAEISAVSLDWNQELERVWPGEERSDKAIQIRGKRWSVINGREFILAGDYLFVTEEIWKKKQAELESLKNHVIITPLKPKGALSPRPDFISGQHTLLAVLFMQAYQDHIQNQVVLDAGSQQGILLVLASRLGAAKVIGVEKHLQWVHDSEASFVQNSIQNAQMIHADFKDLAQHPAAEEASVWMTSLPENGSEFEPGYLGNRHLDFAAREHIKTYFLFGGRTHIVGTPADFPPEFLKLGWSLQETFTHPSPEYADYLVQVFTRNPGGLLHFPDNRSEMRSHDSLKKIPGLVMLWKNAGTYQLKPGEIWFQIGAYLFLSDKTSASLLQDWLENKHPKPGTRETEAEWQRFILRCRKFALYHDLLSNKMNGAHVYPDSIFVFKAAHERDVFVMRITDSRHPNNMNLEQWEGPYDQRPVAKTLAPYQDVLFDERRDELDAASPRQETPVYAMPLTASPDGKTMSGTMFLFPPPIFQLYADPVVAHDGLYGTVVSYGKILMRPELLSFGDGKTIYLEPRIDGSIATEDLVFPAIYFDWIQSLARTYEGFQMSGLNAGGLDFGGLMHQHQVAVASGKTFDDYWKQHPQELFSLNAPLEFVRSQEFRSQIYQMAVEGFQEFSFGRAPLLKPLRENDSNHYSHGVYEMNLETILPALEQARQLKLRQEIEHGSLRAYLYQGECNWGRENPERWDPHGLDRDFVFHPDALYLDLRTQEGALVFRQELARPSIFLTPLIIHEFGDRFSLSDDWQRLAASTDIPAFPWNPGGLLHFPDNRSELRASRVTLPELSEKGLSITRSEVRSYAGDREGKPALLTFQRAYKQFGHNDFKLEEYLSKYPDKDAATVRGHVMRLESLGILEIKHKEQPVKNHSFSIRVFDAKNLREAEFILSMLETKHDEVPVRSLMERFFKVKKLFFVPSQSLDYSKMESAFRKRDPSFKHANPYITYLLIKKYFYSIFKMSAAFQYVQGISYGGFHIQMDALLEAGLLQSVQIKADPKTTSSKTHWLKLVDLNPHQEKQTLQALKEYSRNPQKDRLKAEVSRILRDGTIPEAPTPAVPVYDVWSLFSSGEPASQPQESAPLTLPAILHAIDQTVKSGKVHPNLKDVGTPLKTNRHILNLFAARNGVRLRDLEVWGSNLPSDDEEFNALMDEKLQRLRTEKNSWALIPIPVEALLEEIHIVAASSLKVRAAAAQGDLAGKGVIFSPRSPEESRDLEAYTERYLASLGLKPDLANKAYVLQEDEKWWRHRGLQSKDHPMDANDRTVLVQAEKEWREALLQRRKSKKDLYDYVKVLLDNAEAGLKTALEQRKPSAIRIARKKLEALNPGHPLIAQSLNQSGTANVEISKVIPDRVVPEPSRPAVPVPEISRGLVPIAKSIAEVLAPVASKNLSVTVPAESTKTKKDEGAIITDADRKRAGQLIHDMSRPPGSKATLSLSQILPDIVSRAKLSGAADDWKVVLIVVERIRKQAKKTDEEYLRSVEAMALEKIIHPRSEIRNPIVDLGVFGLVDDEARHRFLDAIIKDTDALLLHGIAFLSNKSQFSPTKLNPQIVFQTEIFSKAAAEMVAELVWKGDAFHKAGGFHALLVQRGGQNILTVYPEKIPAPFRPQALRQSVRSEVRISNLQELQPAPKEMNIELAVLDWDGTISRIREGWEGIMAPYAAMIVSGGEALTQGEWKEILKGVQNEEAVDPETLMTSVMEKMVDSGRISEDAMKWTIKMIEESKGDPTPLQFERAYKEAVRRGHQTQADVFIRSLGGNPEDSDSLKDTLTKVYLDQLYVVRDYRLKLVSDGHRSADHFLIPGGAEFIRELQARGAQVVIITGSEQQSVQEEVDILKLENVRVRGYERGKPIVTKRVMMEELQQKSGIKKEEGFKILAAGDGKREIKFGVALGWMTLAIPSRDNARHFKKILALNPHFRLLQANYFPANLLAAFFIPRPLPVYRSEMRAETRITIRPNITADSKFSKAEVESIRGFLEMIDQIDPIALIAINVPVQILKGSWKDYKKEFRKQGWLIPKTQDEHDSENAMVILQHSDRRRMMLFILSPKMFDNPVLILDRLVTYFVSSGVFPFPDLSLTHAKAGELHEIYTESAVIQAYFKTADFLQRILEHPPFQSELQRRHLIVEIQYRIQWDRELARSAETESRARAPRISISDLVQDMGAVLARQGVSHIVMPGSPNPQLLIGADMDVRLQALYEAQAAGGNAYEVMIDYDDHTATIRAVALRSEVRSPESDADPKAWVREQEARAVVMKRVRFEQEVQPLKRHPRNLENREVSNESRPKSGKPVIQQGVEPQPKTAAKRLSEDLARLQAEQAQLLGKANKKSRGKEQRSELRKKVEPTLEGITEFIHEIEQEFLSTIKAELHHKTGWRMCANSCEALSKILSIKFGLELGRNLNNDHIEVKIGIFSPPGHPEKTEEQTYLLIHLGKKVVYVDPVYLALMRGADPSIHLEVFDAGTAEKALKEKYHILPFDPRNEQLLERRFHHVEEALAWHEAAERSSGDLILSLLNDPGIHFPKGTEGGKRYLINPHASQVRRTVFHFLSPEEQAELSAGIFAALPRPPQSGKLSLLTAEASQWIDFFKARNAALDPANPLELMDKIEAVRENPALRYLSFEEITQAHLQHALFSAGMLSDWPAKPLQERGAINSTMAKEMVIDIALFTGIAAYPDYEVQVQEGTKIQLADWTQAMKVDDPINHELIGFRNFFRDYPTQESLDRLSQTNPAWKKNVREHVADMDSLLGVYEKITSREFKSRVSVLNKHRGTHADPVPAGEAGDYLLNWVFGAGTEAHERFKLFLETNSRIQDTWEPLKAYLSLILKEPEIMGKARVQSEITKRSELRYLLNPSQAQSAVTAMIPFEEFVESDDGKSFSQEQITEVFAQAASQEGRLKVVITGAQAGSPAYQMIQDVSAQLARRYPKLKGKIELRSETTEQLFETDLKNEKNDLLYLFKNTPLPNFPAGREIHPFRYQEENHQITSEAGTLGVAMDTLSELASKARLLSPEQLRKELPRGVKMERGQRYFCVDSSAAANSWRTLDFQYVLVIARSA